MIVFEQLPDWGQEPRCFVVKQRGSVSRQPTLTTRETAGLQKIHKYVKSQFFVSLCKTKTLGPWQKKRTGNLDVTPQKFKANHRISEGNDNYQSFQCWLLDPRPPACPGQQQAGNLGPSTKTGDCLIVAARRSSVLLLLLCIVSRCIGCSRGYQILISGFEGWVGASRGSGGLIVGRSTMR